MKVTETALMVEWHEGRSVGICHIPEQPRPTGVIFVSGTPQTRVGAHRQFTLFARFLAANGYPALRFDRAGFGDSQGSALELAEPAIDIMASIDVLLEQCPNVADVVLVGLCDGASATILHGFDHPKASAFILINPWVHTQTARAKANIRHHYPQRARQAATWSYFAKHPLWGIKAFASFVAQLITTVGWQHRDMTPAFIDRIADKLASNKKPRLIILSEDDPTAREFIDLMSRKGVKENTGENNRKATLRLAGTDHTFTGKAAEEKLWKLTIEWLDQLSLGGEPSSEGSS
jgi:uncharacterized protein